MHSKPTQLLCRHLINYCADTRGVTLGVGQPQMAHSQLSILWLADRWALVLSLGCILLGAPVLSGLWALLVSETQVQDIMCISSMFTCVFLIL